MNKGNLPEVTKNLEEKKNEAKEEEVGESNEKIKSIYENKLLAKYNININDNNSNSCTYKILLSFVKC